MSSKEKVSADSPWVAGLAAFLRRNEEVEALRVDTERRKIEVATLGEADIRRLQARLAETIRCIESGEIAPEGGTGGLAVSGVPGGSVEVAKPTCPTAPSLWRWREMTWPLPDTEEETGEEEPDGEGGGTTDDDGGARPPPPRSPGETPQLPGIRVEARP